MPLNTKRKQKSETEKGSLRELPYTANVLGPGLMDTPQGLYSDVTQSRRVVPLTKQKQFVFVKVK